MDDAGAIIRVVGVDLSGRHPSIPLASLPVLFYHATMKRFTHLAVLVMSLQGFLTASDQPNQQDAVSRLEQDVAKTNIFELPSFAMKASIQVESQGKLTDGTYQLLWNGPDQWREEVNLPGYSGVQIGGKGVIWVQRSGDFTPLPVFFLHQALGFGSSVTSAGSPQSMSLVHVALAPGDTIKNTKKRQEHGDGLTCFEIEEVGNGGKQSSEICVNDSSDTVARASIMFTDGNLQPVGTKMFPRLLTLHRGHKVLARVNVSELASPAQFPSDAFTLPAGASSRAGCMNPTPVRSVSHPNPEYPPMARKHHADGTVGFDVLIGADGIPRVRKVVESAGPDLEDSSRRALSQWRYDPARCNGKPVEVETFLEFNFATF